MYMRRKKLTSFVLPFYRSKSQWLRKRSHPYLTDDITSESSNSFKGSPLKSMTFQNSTVKSDVYTSESYQHLMNKNVTLRNRSSSRLERIEETNHLSIDFKNINDRISKEVTDIRIEKEVQDKESLNSDSSSVVTLPTSPVLSIVENISISKSMLSDSKDFAFEEELPRNELEGQIMLNELMKIEGDVSMPLMQQECGIETSAHNGVEYHYNLNVPKTSVSESFVNNMDVVNIEDPTLSESIQSKLKNLMLDSAKKKYQSDCDSLMNKNPKDVQNEGKLGEKVTKPKKRSSTPRKRQSTRKIKLITNEPCIEEEHMETCSQTSRKSCPPMIQVLKDLNIDNEMNSSVQISDHNVDRSKGRKIKNIIKVKITKPKSKELNKAPIEKRNEDTHMSIQTDSGINVAESSVFLNTFNDSIDLIHNHSETCLNANECLGDSVEIVQNSTQSIISIDSNSNKVEENIFHKFLDNLTDKFAHELYSNDAQDVSVLQKATGLSEYKTADSAAATVYHTPLGSLSPPESLMTEDLSDEIREKTTRNSTKWFLFSEDEITNTNSIDINHNSIAPFGFGANLNEIFPITCAIPNLSTITEMSKENDENTKKFNDDTNTRNDLDSQSLFN
ncbi:unnamed protein product [Euphydryas editha]|uniref:Uncharacterized protein n=1 Tax=Euphydryas editha TaxID=104508 RepID=A0AAU9TRH0_EUPED|nr:unnamed protein product [Euphydryas editha]